MSDLDQSPAVPYDLKADGPTFGFEKNFNPSGGTVPGGSPGQVQYNAFGTFGGLTGLQLTALLNLFSSTLSGIVPPSGGGTTNFLRADGIWVTPPSSGGLSDGDKGDITVSGGGSIWTIDPSVVTYPKIQNVSSNRVLGRIGGSGQVQEVTGTQITALLDIFSASMAGVVPASGGDPTKVLHGDGTWGALTGTVTSVSNSDGSLIITPTTGAVDARISLSHANIWTTGQTFTRIFFGTADGFGINDTSSLPANGSRFWSSNMSRFNRVFIGLAGATDGNNVPQSPTVLSATYSPAWTQNSQLGVMSAMGLNAITGLSRASDWVTFSGTASQGTEGIIGWGLNDDATTVGGSIAVGGNLIGLAAPGSKGITIGTQNDINSTVTPVTIDPFTGFPSGTTIATLSTSGAYSGLATQACSAAQVVAQGNAQQFNTGLIFMAGSLVVPGGGKSVAIALPQNYAVIWYTGAGTKGASIFCDPSGNLNITCLGSVIINGVTLSVP